MGDPNNPNRLYAAVTAPNAAPQGLNRDLRERRHRCDLDPGIRRRAERGNIQGATQTVIKIATGPGGAIAAGVVNLATNKVTGLFWSGNSGANWTQLPTPALNDGV